MLLFPMRLYHHSTDWMVIAMLFNWVDVSVACTSTPRLSVNQATACCCAVLIIAHSTVYTAWWYFSRHSLFCASSAVRQMLCTNKTRTDLKKKSIFNALMPSKVQSCQSRILATLIRTGIRPNSFRCVMWSQYRREGEGSCTAFFDQCESECGVILPSLPWLSEVVFACMIRNKAQTKEMESEKDIALLHAVQNYLHQLRRQVHLLIDHARLPQHHHSHVHNVLCRQGPQCMCGWSPWLGCRYCGVTSVSEWCV